MTFSLLVFGCCRSNILSIYQKCSIIHREAALSINWLKKLVDSVVPLFEREQSLNITPLPLGTSAARSFVRVGAARRAREGKRRSVSPRTREPRGAGPSCLVHASHPDRSSWQLGNDGVRDPMGFHSPNLLEDGYDIRKIQELLGHKDVATTMIYTHVLNRGGKGVRSPADAL